MLSKNLRSTMWLQNASVFFSINLGRGPRAFQTGKISVVNPKLDNLFSVNY